MPGSSSVASNNFTGGYVIDRPFQTLHSLLANPHRPHTLLNLPLSVCALFFGMKTIAHRLTKIKFQTCKVSYSPTYTNFVPNYIASNPGHPLYITQRRRQQEHKREGLWWHATNGTDISKSGCVRTWSRRRLRHAFIEELEAKGYDETGKLVDATAMQNRTDVMNVVRLGRNMDLMGSLRMHGDKPLVPAKYETVKEEMRSIVDALIASAVDNALGFAGEAERSGGLGQRSARTPAPSQRKRPQGRTSRSPMAARSTSEKQLDVTTNPLRIKPQTPSSDAPFRIRRAVPVPTKHRAVPRPATDPDRSPVCSLNHSNQNG